MMATILEFRQAECDRAETLNRDSTEEPIKGKSAEIIIFPGVRIERRAGHETGNTAAKPEKRAKGAAHRKS